MSYMIIQIHIHMSYRYTAHMGKWVATVLNSHTREYGSSYFQYHTTHIMIRIKHIITPHVHNVPRYPHLGLTCLSFSHIYPNNIKLFIFISHMAHGSTTHMPRAPAWAHVSQRVAHVGPKY